MDAEDSGIAVSVVVCGRTVHPVIPKICKEKSREVSSFKKFRTYKQDTYYMWGR